MRPTPILTAILLTILAGAGQAHPGHVADQSGHTHWLALGALGLAAIVALAVIVSVLRRRRSGADERRV